MKHDGVSARVLLREKPRRGNKRTRDGRKALPRCGLLTVEELCESVFDEQDTPSKLEGEELDKLNKLSAREQNAKLNTYLDERCHNRPTIVGADPGMWELLRLSNPDVPLFTRKERVKEWGEGEDRKNNKKWIDKCAEWRCGYTLKQRREEMTPGRYFLKKRHEGDAERTSRRDAASAYRQAHMKTPSEVKAAEHALSEYNSNGPTAAKLLDYLKARADKSSVLDPYYTNPIRRHLRWKRFISEQRSFSQFCNRIRRMMQPREKPFVVAYGAKALSNNLAVKGIPSCINKGLLRKLSKEFVVVAVPEHYTSQRCFHCKAECGNHLKIAEEDRRKTTDGCLEKRLGERLARTDNVDKKNSAMRGFERARKRPCVCSGCKRCLNRDANSAPQMAVQRKRLMLEIGPLYKLTKKEQTIETLENKVESH
jgi:hypothetical protein